MTKSKEMNLQPEMEGYTMIKLKRAIAIQGDGIGGGDMLEVLKELWPKLSYDCQHAILTLARAAASDSEMADRLEDEREVVLPVSAAWAAEWWQT